MAKMTNAAAVDINTSSWVPERWVSACKTFIYWGKNTYIAIDETTSMCPNASDSKFDMGAGLWYSFIYTGLSVLTTTFRIHFQGGGTEGYPLISG
jgi:hypothetical protein